MEPVKTPIETLIGKRVLVMTVTLYFVGTLQASEGGMYVLAEGGTVPELDGITGSLTGRDYIETELTHGLTYVPSGGVVALLPLSADAKYGPASQNPKHKKGR